MNLQSISNQNRMKQIVDPADDHNPPEIKIKALTQLPSSNKNIAAGTQTTNAPSTGTMANKPMTTPQSNGVGRPSNQNISPSIREFLAPRLARGSLQSFTARTPRRNSGTLDAGPFAHLCRHGSHVSNGVAL